MKEKYQRGKSILKKSSILSKDTLEEKPSQVREAKESVEVSKKAKKSVMFTMSRFAE